MLIYVAAVTGTIECVRHLIQCGANVNRLDMHQRSPLHQAVVYEPCVDWGCNKYSDAQISRLLCSSGADVHARTSKDETPLMLAVQKVLPVETDNT